MVKLKKWKLEDNLVKEINTVDGFNTEIKSGKKLVDFYAPWCGPCLKLGPILEDMSVDVNYDIVKVNIDVCPEVAATYSVKSIPMLILFNDGEVEKTSLGLRTKNELIDEFV